MSKIIRQKPKTPEQHADECKAEQERLKADYYKRQEARQSRLSNDNG